MEKFLPARVSPCKYKYRKVLDMHGKVSPRILGFAASGHQGIIDCVGSPDKPGW